MLINTILQSYFNKFVVVYFNNIIMFSNKKNFYTY